MVVFPGRFVSIHLRCPIVHPPWNRCPGLPLLRFDSLPCVFQTTRIRSIKPPSGSGPSSAVAPAASPAAGRRSSTCRWRTRAVARTLPPPITPAMPLRRPTRTTRTVAKVRQGTRRRPPPVGASPPRLPTKRQCICPTVQHRRLRGGGGRPTLAVAPFPRTGRRVPRQTTGHVSILLALSCAERSVHSNA